MNWILLRGVFEKTIIMWRRYLFNSLSGLATMYIVFCLLFFGFRSVGAAIDVGDTVEGLVVGYLVWVLAIMAYSELSWSVLNEAQAGTLEQMYLSPFGFHWVKAAHLLSTLVLQLAMAGVMLLLMLITTGERLSLDLFSVLPLLLLTVAPVYGVGYMLGGLALVYKRIQAFFQIVQFIFIAFLVVPPGGSPLVQFLPLNLGNHLLRQVMVGGASILQLEVVDLGMLLLVAAVYLAAGLLVFFRCERVARRDGLLGQY